MINQHRELLELKNSDYAALSSLGITFFSEPDFSNAPEVAIARALDGDEYVGNKIYSLLKLFFQQFHDYVRVDLLEKESMEITPVGRATISALALYSAREIGDKRFKKFKTQPLTNEMVLTMHSHDSHRGVERELSEMGIFVRRLGQQPERKIRDLKWLRDNNIWFRNRILMGVGVRADSFSILNLKDVKPEGNP